VTGSHRATTSRATRRGVPEHVEAAPAAERPDAVTREQYRSALALVIDQIDSLTTDRDLLDLLVKQYRSLDQRVDEQSAVIGDQESLASHEHAHQIAGLSLSQICAVTVIVAASPGTVRF
jgi:hypothetical protein